MKGLTYNKRKFQDGGKQDGMGFGMGLGVAGSIAGTASDLLSPLLGQIGEKKAKKKRDAAFTDANLLTDDQFLKEQKKNNSINQSILEQTNAIQSNNLVGTMDSGGKTRSRTAMKGILYKKAKSGAKADKESLGEAKSKKVTLEDLEKKDKENKSRKNTGKILGKGGRKFIPGPKGGF